MNEPANPAPLLDKAWDLRLEGDTEGAAEALELVQEHADQEDDHATAVRALVRQGHLAQDEGNLTQAIDLAQQALALYEEAQLDDKELHVYAQRHLADFQRRAGMRDEALQSYDDALGIYRQLGDSHSLDYANALRGYALALESARRKEQSIEGWRAARDIYATFGIADGVAECALHLGEDA